MEAYPNPFNDELEIKFITDLNDNGKIEVFNSLGLLCISKDISIGKGTNIVSLPNVKDFGSGIYFLNFTSEISGIKSVLKIIKSN